jgi:hypothetical protein
MWGAILGIIDKALGIFKNRQEENNAADVKAAQIKQDVVNEKDRITKAVAARDTGATARDLAE